MVSYAEYYGAEFPDEPEVLSGVVYGPNGDDLEGTLTGIVATTETDGAEITVWSGSDYTQTFVLNVPVGWTKCYFTIKESVGGCDDNEDDDDNVSLIQIQESNPASITDGLLYLNKAVAATLSDASISISGNNVTVTIKAAATAAVDGSHACPYDFAFIVDTAKPMILSPGRCNIKHNVTKTLP